jgi:hypothetical protein
VSIRSDEVAVRGFNFRKDVHKVETRAGKSAFGDMRTSDIFPLAGWTFAYGLNPAIVTTSVTGSASINVVDSHAVLSTGTTAGSVARLETVKTNRYIPGIGGVLRFTCPFLVPPTSVDGYALVGLFDDEEGWGFGYIGAEFGVFRRRNSVTNFIPQADFNGEGFPHFNPAFGIPFELSFQWLGYGAQMFKASLPNGAISVLHTIEYSNTSDEVSVLNPNLPIAAEVSNGSATEDVRIATPSAMAGLEGDALSVANSVVLADDVEAKAITAGVEYPIISLYNTPTFNGVANRLFVQALRLTIAADGNKNVTFRAWVSSTNPVNGTFAPINSAISPVEVNKNATTFSTVGQVKIGTFPVAKAGSENIALADSQFFGYPGQYITVTASSSNTSDISSGIGFRQYL